MKSTISVFASLGPLTRSELERRDRKAGFRNIGYHYVINPDGTVEPCRSHREPSVHDYPRGSTAVGVCLIGGVDQTGPVDNFTREQKEALRKVVIALETAYPGIQVQSKMPTIPTDAVQAWVRY